jgi:soluble lytic murein transglycosylase-like protein
VSATRRRWAAVVVALCVALPFLVAGDAPVTEAQGAEVDAIEYGISQGLPRQWAYRVAWCESRYNPGAYNRSSGAAGLFQFIPSTWRNTPQGRAGMSPFDPYANAEAAAWLYKVGGPRHWSCR